MTTFTDQRRSIRVPKRDDASAHAYFVTLCAHHRVSLFGEIVGDAMRLNECGEIVSREWQRSAEIRKEIELDAFVVMPNHFHAIVWIAPEGRGDRLVAPTDTDPQKGNEPASQLLATLVAGFKAFVTKTINELRHSPGQPVWQRNYDEHIIRNKVELRLAREYIQNNPLKWALDRENPHRM